MTQSEDELTSFHISTAALDEADASDILRESIGRVLLQVHMEPLDGERLEGDVTFHAAANFGMSVGTISGMYNIRPPSLIANDDLVLVLMRDGVGDLDQHATLTEVRRGQAVLTDNAAPASFTFHEQFNPISLRFSRSLLAPHLEDLDSVLRAPVLQDGPALRLLQSYAAALGGNALGVPKLHQTSIKHMYDLAALAIGAKRDSAEVAANRGLRAARLHAVKTDIVRNLRDHLSPDAVAVRNGISPRYMRMLFEREGTSFSEFVLVKRLQLAHHMISQMQYVDRPISSIAFDCGFGDLSHFNQAFRRRYGQTPSEVRSSAHSIEH